MNNPLTNRIRFSTTHSFGNVNVFAREFLESEPSAFFFLFSTTDGLFGISLAQIVVARHLFDIHGNVGSDGPGILAQFVFIPLQSSNVRVTML